MKRTHLFLSIFFFAPSLLFSQANDSLKTFIPNGKFEGRIFSNFFYELNQKKTAFEVTRAYLGYSYNLSESISARVTFDISKPDISINGKTSDTLSTTLHHTVYLRYAYGVYQKNNFTFSFGIIDLNQLHFQDKFWSRRYIMKTIQDEFGFCPKADLGVKGEYKANKWLSTDFCIRNGEGFKKNQLDNKFWYGIGITVQPFNGLIFRSFVDYSKKVISQINFSNFIGYRNKTIMTSAEIVLANNAGFGDGKKLYAFSVYTSYKLLKKVELFGRFDKLSSNNLTGEAITWNYSNNSSFALCGVQYSFLEHFVVSLNGRYKIPQNSEVAKKLSLYVNIDLGF